MKDCPTLRSLRTGAALETQRGVRVDFRVGKTASKAFLYVEGDVKLTRDREARSPGNVRI